jgi:hypothetical protein
MDGNYWYFYLTVKCHLDPTKRFWFDFGKGSFYCYPSEFSNLYKIHQGMYPNDFTFEINED